MKNSPIKITELGRNVGAQLVRLYEPVVDEMAKAGIPDERCNSCALRLGSVPNGYEPTLNDLLKCGMEWESDFLCHEDKNQEKLCHGYLAMRKAMAGRKTKTGLLFADEYEKQGPADIIIDLNQPDA